MRQNLKVILISTFLSWVVFDPNLFRRRSVGITLSPIELALEEAELEQQIKKQRNRHDVIPKWHHGARKALRMKCNYFSTKPRDVRFSDQQKLRRMFNNM